MTYARSFNTVTDSQNGMNYCEWKGIFAREDKRRCTINKNLGKRLSLLLHSLSFLVLVSVYLVFSSTPLWDSTGDGLDNCVRKQGGQETFEWLCVEGETIYLAKSDNIKNCYTCFLKKFSEWTWEQEIRKGVREDPKYITCRRYKRVMAKSGQQVCLYRGANNTYTLVVEGQCPSEYRCIYDPNGEPPNIDNVQKFMMSL